MASMTLNDKQLDSSGRSLEKGLILGFVLALLPFGLWAQDFERVAPKPVPNTETEPSLPAPEPRVEGSQEILVKKLVGILVLDSTDKVKRNPPAVQGLRAEGNDLLNKEEFQQVTAKYLGQPLSIQAINALVKDLIVFYRDQDRPVVDVVVPEQDITSGVLQIVAVEGKVGEVRTEGNRWFSSTSLSRQVRVRPGEQIRSSRILEDVAWLNQNPFRESSVVFTPGSELGTTDLVLKTEDRFPVRFYAGYEDSGNDLTGDERFLAGFNWGDAFFVGHQLNYQFTGSSDLFDAGADFDNLRAHSFSYLAPLPWRHTLNVFGSLSSSESELTPFSLSGSSAQAGLRYTVPLPRITKHYQHEIYGGFDWKQSDNTLEFGFVPATATTTDVGQWVLGYRSTLTDPWGVWSLAPELVWSPGEYFGHQNDAAYQAVRANASSDYVYGKIKLSRVTRLPWDFSLSNEFNAQISSSNLLGSEQMSFGGYSSVRGYDERELSNTDEGWMVRNELRAPAISILQWFGVKGVKDQLQFLGFFDYGSAEAHTGNVTRQDGLAVGSETLASAGPGLRYSVNSWLTVRADYGFQLNDAGNDRHDSRWHVGVIVSY
ncbi:MAG: ShlB/FhaC/HecB family hemolysin secretion/activation protein [Blastochloris sp.]|nr:ShlB/FhaC/HecB family hemolysin secretion/activation protein [Blastochloris sp.]